MDDNVCLEFLDLVAPRPEFHYSPIRRGWIRVFDLLNKPGDDEPFQCRLRHVELKSPEANYNALSYVWGKDRTPFQMEVLQESRPGASSSGGPVPLTRSLYHALKDLRDCVWVQPKTFWIDQICIDQRNDEEKGHQVAQMGDVFEYATRVWTYLGPQQEMDEKAFDLLVRIYKHFEPLTRSSDLGSLLQDIANIDMYYRMDREDISFGLVFPEDLSKGEKHVIFTHLNSMIYGPWTTRLWLYQENILNRNLTFLRGPRTLNSEAVRLIVGLSYLGLLPKNVQGTFGVHKLMRKRHERHQEQSIQLNPGFELRELIEDTAKLLCHDPRDRIYAVLGIATNAKYLGIHPDYDISTVQAFTNLSVAHTRYLMELGDHNPLRHLEETSLEPSFDKSYTQSPTWVPTYLGAVYRICGYTDVDASQTATREASKRFADSIGFESRREVKDGILVARGMRLDLTLVRYLASFSRATSLNGFLTEENLEQLLKIFEEIEKFAIEADHVLSRFWEACTMGRNILDTTVEQADGEEAAADAFRDILNLLRRAQSGDRIVDKDYESLFYLRSSTLPGGENSAAYSFIKKEVIVSRSLWLSKDQHMCLAPRRLREGDIPVILFGGRWIYFLRPVGDKFEYIGWGYITGSMHGEPFVDGWEDKVETFKLI